MKTVFLISTLAVFFAFCACAEEKKVLLKTPIPRPFPSSELINVHNTNLEPRAGKQELYVPIGTTNLALHRPVTASSKAVIGNLSMVTDGDKEGDEGGWLELQSGTQWVQVDLQRQAQIYGIWVWHFHLRTRVYSDVAIAISSDPAFKRDVNVVFNSDVENTLGLGKGTNLNYFDDFRGKLIDTKGIVGRYVRLYSNGNNENKMNHYVEVEVFGK